MRFEVCICLKLMGDCAVYPYNPFRFSSVAVNYPGVLVYNGEAIYKPSYLSPCVFTGIPRFISFGFPLTRVCFPAVLAVFPP